MTTNSNKKEVKEMPRLVGQRSNTGANITGLIIFVAIVGVLLEYLGAINIVPDFGREGAYFQLQGQPTNELDAGQTN